MVFLISMELYALLKGDKTQMNKEYSVLMSVYDQENHLFLRQSIESMFSQTIKPSQFVLVLDGKLTRELYEEIENLKQRYEIETVPLKENIGLAAALNAGLEKCSYEIIARMDSDDISFGDRMEKQLALMDESGADILSAPVLEFEVEPENVTAKKSLPTSHEEILKYIRKRNPFNHPATVYKKSLVQSSGGYSDYGYFEDYELFARMISAGAKTCNANEPLLYMRAGKDMYSRRGGAGYVKKIKRFYKKMSELGFCGLKEKILVVFPRMIIAILPAGVRKFVYEKFLRG